MDDTLAINVARTAIRDGYNTGDLDLLCSVLDEGLVNFSDGTQCWWGTDGIAKLRAHLARVLEENQLKYTVIIIEIRVMGDLALEYGWQIFDSSPRNGDASQRRRERYMDLWQRRPQGWRLISHITNLDVPDTLAREA